MDLDKLIIQYPAYQWMVWPTEHSRPPSSDALQDDACARGLLYFHLNMFDMAHGYYTRILGYGARRAIMARDRQERDDWEGWKEYMRNFMAQEYAATIFRSEGERWFSPEFVKFLGQMITEGQSSAKAAKVHILAPSASYSGSTGVQY